MKKSAVLIILIIGFTLGYGVNYVFKTPEKDPQIVRLESFKQGLLAISHQDLEEYKKLKTLEEKYTKSEEILEKMFKLILIDIGIRIAFPLTPAEQLQREKALQAENKPLPPAPSNPAPPTNFKNTESASAQATKPVSWQRYDRNIMASRSPEEALEKIKRIPPVDVFSELKQASNLDTTEVKFFEGTFDGEINFYDKKENPSDWTVRIENEPTTLVSGVARGRQLITLTRKSDNKVMSRTRSGARSTYNNHYQQPAGSESFIINVQNDDGYIHVYPVGGGSQWVGNYYEKIKLDQFKLSGTVVLNKTR